MKNILILVILFCNISCQAKAFKNIANSSTEKQELYVNDQNYLELFYDQFVPKKTIKKAFVILPPEEMMAINNSVDLLCILGILKK